MVLALFFMPDSPKFLISKNRISEARQALRWFRGPNYDVDSEFKQILTSNKEEENIGGISLLELFTQKVYFVPFLIAMYGMFGQQFCGINVVFFYLQTIFDKANSTVDPCKYKCQKYASEASAKNVKSAKSAKSLKYANSAKGAKSAKSAKA